VTIRVSRGPRAVARKRRVVRTEGWRLRESVALVWRTLWN
jgi:hypothetical protein